MRVSSVGCAGLGCIVTVVALAGCDRGADRMALAACQEAVRSEEAEKKRLEAEIKEQRAKLDALLAQLASAKDEAQRAALLKQLEAAKGQAKAKGASPACNCRPDDPLCSCL